MAEQQSIITAEHELAGQQGQRKKSWGIIILQARHGEVLRTFLRELAVRGERRSPCSSAASLSQEPAREPPLPSWLRLKDISPSVWLPPCVLLPLDMLSKEERGYSVLLGLYVVAVGLARCCCGMPCSKPGKDWGPVVIVHCPPKAFPPASCRHCKERIRTCRNVKTAGKNARLWLLRRAHIPFCTSELSSTSLQHIERKQVSMVGDTKGTTRKLQCYHGRILLLSAAPFVP